MSAAIGRVAGTGSVRRKRPLPHVSEHVAQAAGVWAVAAHLDAYQTAVVVPRVAGEPVIVPAVSGPRPVDGVRVAGKLLLFPIRHVGAREEYAPIGPNQNAVRLSARQAYSRRTSWFGPHIGQAGKPASRDKVPRRPPAIDAAIAGSDQVVLFNIQPVALVRPQAVGRAVRGRRAVHVPRARGPRDGFGWLEIGGPAAYWGPRRFRPWAHSSITTPVRAGQATPGPPSASHLGTSRPGRGVWLRVPANVSLPA